MDLSDDNNGPVEGWQPVPALADIVELSSEDETEIKKYAATNHNIGRVKKERRNSDAYITSNDMIRSTLRNQNTKLPKNVATSTVHASFDVSNVDQRPVTNQLSLTYSPEFPINHVETQSNALFNELATNSIDANNGENRMLNVFNENHPAETSQNDVIYGSIDLNGGILHGQEYSTYNSDCRGIYNHNQPIYTQPMNTFFGLR